MLPSSALLLLTALLAAPQAPQDPEQTPAGRTHFLGRQIAQTMHWTGAPWLLRQTREDEENGAVLREWLAVLPGQVVCDLGCGNGYHTLPLARAVGKNGKVFAVDLQPQMLTLLRLRAERENLDNLEYVEATVSDPRLPPASCDLVLLVDVYHELSHPVRVMAAIRRALRPGGRLVLVEFRAEDASVPIKPEHKMTKAQVVLEMASHGFEAVDEFDGLPWQHAMAFAAAPESGSAARHWAFVPPRRPTPPAGEVSPIDAFVRARLAAEGLAPAPAAARGALIRRVTQDLTGLPPTPEEVLAFVADAAPDAYERLLDRLFASPHYGERMALPWLDAARYADTNGFSIDGGRHAWLWRDYVIDAFARNKPYDVFLREQLAGDLLPERDDTALLATGFQRNSMITHEGGTIPEENLVVYAADRVKTFGEAVLGLTLGCAQCHDHKSDPISQRDYYAMFAYWNGTSEPALGGDRGINAAPVASARSPLQTGEEAALQARIAALQAALDAPAPADVAAWESEQRALLATRGRDLQLHPVTLLQISMPNAGSGFSIEGGRYALIERPLGMAAFDVSMRLPALPSPPTGLRVVMHAAAEAPVAGWGYGGPGGKKTFVLTNLTISADGVPSDQVNLYRQTPIAAVTANCWEERPEGCLDTLPDAGWRPQLDHDGPVHLTATFAAPLRAADTFLTAQLNFGRGDNLMARRMEFFVITGNDDGSALPAAVIEALQIAPVARSAAQAQAVLAHYRDHAPALARLRIDLANARERLAVRTQAFSALVMDSVAKPRETRVLHRGDYSQPRALVTPATLPVLPPPPPGAPTDRLGLAQWVTMPGHPLTARVAVNRFWQMLFGVGLVRTAADFGLQGEPPSHPELLDWLATEFVASGWDVQHLLRTILRSQTYRQSSATSAEQLERDPDNRLLARGPRFRLPAEFVRDGALAVSGLLVPQLGGPSVNPYTPGDPWREISHYGSTPATAQAFVQDHGEKLYRRSLYTYWKRTLPPPNMAIFDAPNREVCVVDRAATNTPLQALVLLNDVQFVEAARAFAARILRQAADDAERLRWAFLAVTSREPEAAELVVLRRALARERATFAAAPARAHELLRVGEAPRDAALAVVEHAAWTQLAALLLNLSENLVRN